VLGGRRTASTAAMPCGDRIGPSRHAAKLAHRS
jgi:hypothetical protein